MSLKAAWVAGIVISLAVVSSLNAQNLIASEIDWANTLFAKDVDFGEFACEASYSRAVRDYFRLNPLKRPWQIGLCHNNCAVLSKFPTAIGVPLDKRLLGEDVVHIHVLVNSDGVPVYARPLNGHSAVAAILRNRACSAKFQNSEGYRQNVLSLCPASKCRPGTPIK